MKTSKMGKLACGAVGGDQFVALFWAGVQQVDSSWCSAKDEGMTLINHPGWFPLRESRGSSPLPPLASKSSESPFQRCLKCVFVAAVTSPGTHMRVDFSGKLEGLASGTDIAHRGALLGRG